MQGNKGGPAIALSLMKVLNEEFKSHEVDANWVMSVPSHIGEYKQELIWSQTYKQKILPTAYASSLIRAFWSLRELKNAIRYIRTYIKANVVLQMSALVYVGPPSDSGSWKKNLLSQRFFDFALSKLTRTPMVAWTQSYGPFSTVSTKIVAKADLNTQTTIFCRGADCAAEVQNLLPNKIVKDYPDVACSLPYSTTDGQNLIKLITGSYREDSSLCTLSLSSVFYDKSLKKGENSNDVLREYVSIIETIASNFDKVILLPHTFRPLRKDPRKCDFALSEKVFQEYNIVNENNKCVYLSTEDISCTQIKSIISNASLHIGGRYHSIIASLSSHVPTIALSWHPKYLDALRQYGQDNYHFDIFSENSSDIEQLIQECKTYRANIIDRLKRSQLTIEDQIRQNAKEWVNDCLLKSSL